METRDSFPPRHSERKHRPTVIARLEEVRAMKSESKLHIVEIVTHSNFKDRQQNFDEIEVSDNSITLNMSDEKIGLIKEFPFEAFCERNFKTVFSWGTKIPITEILSFSSTLIDTSLIKIPKEQRETARQLFNSILGYMRERATTKSSLHYVLKCLKIIISGSSELHDEFFCQLIKQTNNNPNIESALRAWTLFGIVSGVVAPSSAIRLPLLNHLLTVIQNESQEITRRATYCATRLEGIFNNGSRLVMPSELEIKHIEAMKPFPISVYFKNGSCVTMLVESHNNTSEVRRTLLKQLNIPIPKMVYFGLYEIVQDNGFFDERYIEEEELIMDIVTSGLGTSKLVLQYRVFPRFLPAEHEVVSFYFLQISFDVIIGKLPIQLEQAVVLAGLMLHVERGNFIDEATLDRIDFKVYIPLHMLNSLSYENWVKRISKSYKENVGLNSREAKVKYVETLRGSPFFASSSFHLLFKKATGGHKLVLPSELLMTINARGVDFHTNSMTRHLLFLPFGRIVSWGVSKNILMIVAHHDHCQVSIYLNTVQARLIHSLSQDYALLSVDRPLKQTHESSSSRVEGLRRDQATRYLGLAIRLFDIN